MENEGPSKLRFRSIRRDPSPDGCRDQDDLLPLGRFTGEQ